MSEKKIVQTVKLTNALRSSLRLATIKDVFQGNVYYWTPEMGGLGDIAKNEVDFKYHKSDKDIRLYMNFFKWLIKDGRMHVIKEVNVKKQQKDSKDGRKEDISQGTSLFD